MCRVHGLVTENPIDREIPLRSETAFLVCNTVQHLGKREGGRRREKREQDRDKNKREMDDAEKSHTTAMRKCSWGVRSAAQHANRTVAVAITAALCSKLRVDGHGRLPTFFPPSLGVRQ